MVGSTTLVIVPANPSIDSQSATVTDKPYVFGTQFDAPALRALVLLDDGNSLDVTDYVAWGTSGTAAVTVGSSGSYSGGLWVEVDPVDVTYESAAIDPNTGAPITGTDVFLYSAPYRTVAIEKQVGGNIRASTASASNSKITADFASGLLIADTTVQVVAKTLEKLIINPSRPSSITNDQTLQFTCFGQYSDGTTSNLTNTVTWAATPSFIVNTFSNGLFTPQSTVAGVGNVAVTITATYQGLQVLSSVLVDAS